MTHEQFIKPKTAKLAKQAGFDWKCNERYNERYATNDSEPLYVSPRDNWNQYAGLYSAPTQSVLQRWLREVKNREVIVDIDLRIAHCYEPMLGIVNRYATDDMPAVVWKRIDNARKYHTYEAALEAGLKECLTLIIEFERR